MKKINLSIILIIFLLSSCSLFNKWDTEENNNNDIKNEKEEFIDGKNNILETKDKKTEEEAIEEFDKEVEEILKLLEENG